METSKSSARENILARIRAANARPHPAPPPVAPLDAIFPPITNPRQRFLDECAGNLTEVFQTTDAAASAEALETILSTVPAGQVYVQDDASLFPFVALLEQWRRVRMSSQGAPAESTQATLTLAHGFVAQPVRSSPRRPVAGVARRLSPRATSSTDGANRSYPTLPPH